MDIPGITVILPTLSAVPTRSSSQTESDSDQASRTLSNDEPTSTGSRDYPVFPNGDYIQKFYRVNQKLTKLDVDLYNACYLPFRNLPYDNYNEKRAVRGDGPDEEPLPPNAPQPTYEITSAPCKRQASINANCYFKNTNGTYSGLEVSQEWDVQQQCYCEQYPFFDSVKGCMECFRQHGGIAGYHWYPESYLSPLSSSYCAADPQTTGLYGFAREWAKTDSAAAVSKTTASDVLGTQTDFSLYYTYAAATGSSQNGAAIDHPPSWMALFVLFLLRFMFSW